MDLTAVLADPSFLKILNNTPRSEEDEEFAGPNGTPRRVARRLTSVQVGELVKGYLRRASAGQLGLEFGMAKNTVLKHLARRQVPDRPYRKVHGELFDRAMDLYEAGGSLRSVAKELGIARGALTDALRLAGVEIRTRRAESPWVRWRLLTLETRMESCLRNRRRVGLRRGDTATRRRPRRC
ncbi:MAG: hypothetical protein KDB04_01350, partial [Acidimicrobiales bacterium]|nr:hypothetical protein [Acidimicrobiales bacterium]